MAGLVTDGLVIRRADYGDYDRMITLFTPEHGRIDAIVRGCKRPKSPLMNAAEPFCAGEYQLYHSRERYSVSQCQITDSFYDIREDYEKLTHGVYWLNLLDAAAMPEIYARTSLEVYTVSTCCCNSRISLLVQMGESSCMGRALPVYRSKMSHSSSGVG